MEKLVPPPTSVPRPTVTGRAESFVRAISKRPLPMKKFDVGQWAIFAPVSVEAAQLPFRQMDAVAINRSLIQQAVTLVNVGVMRRGLGRARRRGRSRRGSRKYAIAGARRCVHAAGPRPVPTAAGCCSARSGDVTVYRRRPRLCQRSMSIVRIVITRLRAIDQVRGRMAVHHHQPGQHEHIAGPGRLEDGAHRDRR